jgi:HAD superfamily hydrolase (TIGR01509 family)
MSRAVVFDFGAVLFHWQPLTLLREVVPELAPDDSMARTLAASIFQSFTPESDWALFDLGRLDEATLAQRIAVRIGAQVGQVRRVIDAIPAHLQPQPEMVELLHELGGAGHRLYFLSNMPVPYAAHLERVNPFLSAFRDGIYSGRVGLMKPHASIFELAEQRFVLDPPSTVFIDDHPGNVEAARSRGWGAVHFVEASGCRQALQAQGWLPA